MNKSSYIAENLRYCGNHIERAGYVVLLFLLVLNLPSANAQYFNLRIDFMGYDQGENGYAVEQMDDGNYIVFHGARPETADNLGLGRTIVSPDGEVLEQMAYFDRITVLYTGYSNTSSKLADGGFVSSGSRSWFSGIEDLISLCRYGELEWIQFYGDSINQTLGRVAVEQKKYESCGCRR